MKISGAGFLGLAFFLRDEKNQLVRLRGCLDCGKRRLPPDEQGNYDVWENDDFAKRQNRDAGFRLHLLAVTYEFVSQCLSLLGVSGIRYPVTGTSCYASFLRLTGEISRSG